MIAFCGTSLRRHILHNMDTFSTKLNPRSMWTYDDENFMVKIAGIVHNSWRVRVGFAAGARLAFQWRTRVYVKRSRRVRERNCDTLSLSRTFWIYGVISKSSRTAHDHEISRPTIKSHTVAQTNYNSLLSNPTVVICPVKRLTDLSAMVLGRGRRSLDRLPSGLLHRDQ